MQLSKTEILVLEQIANGNKAVKSLAKALKKSDKQIYVTAKRLQNKGIIERNNEPKKTTCISLLLQLLSKTPNLAPVLSDSGIAIFTAMLRPVTIKDIMNETGLKKTVIYKKLEQAKKRSLVRKNKETFEINDKLWSSLREFLEELKKYEAKIDERIPAGSIIYYKKNDEIIFSSKEELDAVKTAFSAYKDYKIEILTITNYYYLPKKKLAKKDILKHSLYIAEKDMSIKNLIFIALFYAKFKKEFKIKHQIIMNLNAVLAGKAIEGYPTYQEIKDRAAVYGIKIK